MTLAIAASPDLFRMIAAYTRLEVRRAFRNRRYQLFSIGFPVVFYLLYTGVLQGNSARADVRIDGVLWPAYFMVSMAAFGAIGAALAGSRIVATERASGWTRQLRITPLPSAAYVLVRLFVSFVTTIPALVLVLGAGIALNGVTLSPGAWIEELVGLSVGSLPFAALGILIGYAFDGDAAQGAMTIANFTLAILGGLWAPVASFPSVLVTIAHVLPSYHFADLGWRALAGQVPDPADVASLVAWTAVFGILTAWFYRREEQRQGV